MPFLHKGSYNSTNQPSPQCQPKMVILHSEFSRHFICILLTALHFLFCVVTTPCFFVLEYNTKCPSSKERDHISSFICYPSILPRMRYTINIYWNYHSANQPKLRSHMLKNVTCCSLNTTDTDTKGRHRKINTSFPPEKAPNTSQHSAFLRTTWHNPIWVRLTHVASCTN